MRQCLQTWKLKCDEFNCCSTLFRCTWNLWNVPLFCPNILLMRRMLLSDPHVYSDLQNARVSFPQIISLWILPHLHLFPLIPTSKGFTFFFLCRVPWNLEWCAVSSVLQYNYSFIMCAIPYGMNTLVSWQVMLTFSETWRWETSNACVFRAAGCS